MPGPWSRARSEIVRAHPWPSWQGQGQKSGGLRPPRPRIFRPRAAGARPGWPLTKYFPVSGRKAGRVWAAQRGRRPAAQPTKPRSGEGVRGARPPRFCLFHKRGNRNPDPNNQRNYNSFSFWRQISKQAASTRSWAHSVSSQRAPTPVVAVIKTAVFPNLKGAFLITPAR